MEDNERGLALQPLHVTFQDGGARKFKSEKSPSENLDLWTYKIKEHFGRNLSKQWRFPLNVIP